jgi:long-chain fatty acid transport protein
MKTSTKLITLASTALAFAAGAQIAQGAGFAIYETSARGLAIGNADSARATDASTLYTNAAAMTSLKGTQVAVGATAIMPDMRVTSHGTPSGDQITPLNNYTAVAPNAYITRELGKGFAAGLAIFAPYGLKSTFPDNWPGAFNNYYTDIQAVEVNPNIACQLYKNGDQSLSVAAGVRAMYFDVTISKAIIPPPAPAGEARNLVLEGDNTAYGWNLALQYVLNQRLAIGLTYRTEVEQKLDKATARMPAMHPNPAVVGTPQPARGTIVLPQSFSIGVTYTPTPKWLVAAQALWTGWSSFDALDIYINDALASHSVKNWSDVWRYSVGVEHHYNEFIDLRAGFVWDCDPVPASTADFLVPSNDRRIYSLGLGLNFTKGFRFDFSYAVIFIDSRSIPARPADGVLYDSRIDKGHANIVSVSANFSF